MTKQTHLLPGRTYRLDGGLRLVLQHLGVTDASLTTASCGRSIVRSAPGSSGPTRWGTILTELAADSGTIHLLGDDGVLHLKAASAGLPQVVLDTIKDVPVGKGMAGLAVERKEPVNACNIQTDATGDVRPGARATGLQGSVVVPMLRGDDAIGALGVANRGETDVHRTRKNNCCWSRPRAGARDTGDINL